MPRWRIFGLHHREGHRRGHHLEELRDYVQVSVRNIFLVASDMIRTKLFGRDISRMQ